MKFTDKYSANKQSSFQQKYCLLLFVVVFLAPFYTSVAAGPVFEINGFYLGATPEELGVDVEADALLSDKYYEIDVDGVQLFFVRVKGRLRVYRIIKEEETSSQDVVALLRQLKKKYGIPDKQQIKTSSVRKKRQMKYSTVVKNKAIWKFAETNEFIAEIETSRVFFELIDHNPEQIKRITRPDFTGEEGFVIDKDWDPDY
jgi:hypothetical protein